MKRAFTLLETLVALSILGLLALIVAHITHSAIRATELSNRSIDASGQARLAFDRIGLDFANLLKRRDCPFQAGNSDSNILLFLSLASSATPSSFTSGENRGLSCIAYRIAAHADNGNRLCLVRGARALKWTEAGFAGLDSNQRPVLLPGSLQPASSDFDILAPGIFRMAIGFQLYPDNLPATLADGSTTDSTGKSLKGLGQIVYSPPIRTDTGTVSYVDLSRISAVVIGLAVLSPDHLKLLNADQVTTLAASFPTPTAVNTLPKTSWEPIANNPDNLPASVPLPARQSIRIFQRFYPVTPFPEKEEP